MARVPRPIDKRLVSLNQQVGSTQVNLTLFTATFPGTLTGLRWSMSHHVDQAVAASDTCLYWCIYVLREGFNTQTISIGNNSPTMTPEENVMAFGVYAGSILTAVGWVGSESDRGSTKSMRKLQGGDRLMFAAVTVGEAIDECGIIQFFLRT